MTRTEITLSLGDGQESKIRKAYKKGTGIRLKFHKNVGGRSGRWILRSQQLKRYQKSHDPAHITFKHEDLKANHAHVGGVSYLFFTKKSA